MDVEFLKPLVRKLQTLIADTNGLRCWQHQVRSWAKNEVEHSRSRLPGLTGEYTSLDEREYIEEPHPLFPLNPSLGYMFALLAAVNDVVVRHDTHSECDTTGIVIDPYLADEINDQGVPYMVLVETVCTF